MLYLSSTSSDDGSMGVTVTFEIGVDVDMATVLVQNRVAAAEPLLPEDVKRQDLTTRKQSTNMVQVVNLLSPAGRYVTPAPGPRDSHTPTAVIVDDRHGNDVHPRMCHDVSPQALTRPRDRGNLRERLTHPLRLILSLRAGERSLPPGAMLAAWRNHRDTWLRWLDFLEREELLGIGAGAH